MASLVAFFRPHIVKAIEISVSDISTTSKRKRKEEKDYTRVCATTGSLIQNLHRSICADVIPSMTEAVSVSPPRVRRKRDRVSVPVPAANLVQAGEVAFLSTDGSPVATKDVQ